MTVETSNEVYSDTLDSKGGQDDKQKLLEEIRTRFKKAAEIDNDVRILALDDVKFAYIPGYQWEPSLKQRRRNRPCFEFNKVRQAIRQVTGDQRQNSPAIKIRAVDNQNDPELADIYTGLIRNIESQSNADRAYDGAFEIGCAGGFGAWRVTTEYSDDSSFDQDIKIKEIPNPFTVYFDPVAQEYDKRDGRYAFVTVLLSRDEFKQRYPDAELSNFESGFTGDRYADWNYGDRVRLAEYWCKKPKQKTLCLLSNGETVDKETAGPALDELAMQGIQVVSERQVNSEQVCMYIVSGAEVLEGPYEWPGRFIPIIPFYAELMNIEGKWVYGGMVRHSKDAQKTYNFHRTTMIEAVANTPKIPFMVTPAMIKGYEEIWKNAQSENYPYLPYNPDAQAPGAAPRREPMPDVPNSMIALANYDSDDIKATTGIYDASLGARSNETSGRAILARQKEGDTSSFSYMDNLSRSIKFTGEILVDIIPKFYDTQRVVRILGADEQEKYVTLNQTVVDEQTGQPVIINDLSKGKYDVVVSTGPSYNTARMEAAEQLLQLSQNPQIAPVLADLIVKNIDMPGGQEAVKRIRHMMIKQGIIEPGPEDPPPPPPDPMIELQKQMLEEKLLQESLKNDQIMADIKATIATAIQTQMQNEMGKWQMAKADLADPSQMNGQLHSPSVDHPMMDVPDPNAQIPQ